MNESLDHALLGALGLLIAQPVFPIPDLAAPAKSVEISVGVCARIEITGWAAYAAGPKP
jgi:hypothetical protein